LITKTTLKALFAGGGLLATWLVVTPADVPPASSTAPQPAVHREPPADELNERTARLREHGDAMPMRPSTRNPFRFASPRRAAPVGIPSSPAPVIEAPAPLRVAEAALKLYGVAERNTPEGRRRTVTLTVDGQLYLAGEGELVAGRYTVVTVEPEAVVLRDQSGTEIRLALR
jgi:hypothetical protein